MSAGVAVPANVVCEKACVTSAQTVSVGAGLYTIMLRGTSLGIVWNP